MLRNLFLILSVLALSCSGSEPVDSGPDITHESAVDTGQPPEEPQEDVQEPVDALQVDSSVVPQMDAQDAVVAPADGPSDMGRDTAQDQSPVDADH